MKKLKLMKTFLVAAALLMGGSSAWATAVPYTVGTEGKGDAFASRKYSDAYEIAPGETYHFTFTNTSYGTNNWNNWLLDCKATADTAVDDWYFTMRSDNYGWGKSYNSAMRNVDFVWGDFQTVMYGATVDMYVDYNSTDKIIRTYTTITKGETTWHYNFASKAIDQSSVFLLLSEELAVLNITTADKVASVPNGTYTLYKRTTTTTDCGEQWKADDKDNIWVPSTTNDYFTYAIDGGLSLANTSASANFKSAYSASRVLTPNEGSTVSMTAVATMGVAPGRDSSYDYITIGGVSLRVNGQNQNAQVYVDGVAQGTAVSATRNASYTFNVEINQATGDVTYSVSGGATIAEATTSTSTAISNVVIGHNRGGSENYNTSLKLTNIDITEQISAVSYANYTIHFKDNNGATVKADEVRNGEVGATVGANASDKDSFIADDCKYVYSSDGSGTTVTANGSAEFTVTYTKYTSTAYTVMAQVSGNDLTTLASGTAYLDGSTTKYWSKYIKKDDQWYVANETTYGAEITSATTNVAFTATDAIDYFFEAEDMTYSRTYNEFEGTEASNGSAKTLYGDANAVTTTTVAAGVYTVSLNGIKWGDKEDDYEIAYSVDGSNWIPLGNIAYSASEEGVKTLENAIIPTDAYIRIWTTGGVQTPRRYLDYMTLKKTADATVPVSITTAGWATLYTPYALDFTTLSNDFTAYTATLDEAKGTVTLTEVSDVPANTGVVLKAASDLEETKNYSIPMATSSSTDKGSLEGNVDAATAFNAFDGYDLYMLALNGDNEAQFTKVTSGSIAAGKAFLKVAKTVNARALKVVFDESTGIEAIENVKSADNKAYNLAGQRVAKPTKGLYIMNGKKVIVK